METLIDTILTLGHSALASEEAACDTLVAIRYPNGIRCRLCGAPCTHTRAFVACTNHGDEPFEFTILEGTAFETKRKPRVLMIFLGLRALCVSPRSISA